MEKANHVPSRLPRTPLRFALHVSRTHKCWAICAICAVFVGASLGQALAVLLKFVIDAATKAVETGFEDVSTLWMFTLLFPLVYFVEENIWRVSGFCGMRWITGTRSTVNRVLFSYLTKHSSAYFNDRFAGALTNKISNAVRGTGEILSTILWEFFPLLLGFFVSFVIALVSDWRLGLILGGWIIIFLTINIFLVRKKHPYAYAVAEQASVLKGKMVDTTSNILAVQQSATHRYERAYVDRYIESFRNADLKNWWFSEWILLTNGALITLFTAGMFAMSIFLLTHGLITVGTVVMIITIVLNIDRDLFFIGHKMTYFMDNYSQILEGLEELLIPHDIVDKPGAKNLVVKNGEVKFKDVQFCYGEKPIFDQLSLTIHPDEKIGLVGLSGAGKSTLVNVLLRQYELNGGAVSIDDQDIRDVTRKSLRKAISMVPQDVSLFHRSLWENIRYGRLDATHREVVRAAKLAQAHDFIDELPEGYDTFVGERGVKLSGGQRQRVAIARALLKNAPILVLDEATSSLDSENEEAIQLALSELMRGKTVLAIAHRLSTLKAMDRLLVLDKGKIVEDGTHEELLEGDGIYSRLWKGQVSGFIQE